MKLLKKAAIRIKIKLKILLLFTKIALIRDCLATIREMSFLSNILLHGVKKGSLDSKQRDKIERLISYNSVLEETIQALRRIGL